MFFLDLQGAVLKQAYRKAALKWHPDKVSAEQKEARTTEVLSLFAGESSVRWPLANQKELRKAPHLRTEVSHRFVIF